MIPGVNTSFMTFNICHDVQRTHDLIVTDWPVSDRQSYFKTSLVSWTGNAENTAVLINLISVLTEFKIIMILLLQLADKYIVMCFITVKYLYNSQLNTNIYMPSVTDLCDTRPKPVQARLDCMRVSWVTSCVLPCSSVNNHNNWICSWIW